MHDQLVQVTLSATLLLTCLDSSLVLTMPFVHKFSHLHIFSLFYLLGHKINIEGCSFNVQSLAGAEIIEV